MPMRVSGMFSGMDTETIISELVAVRQTKVDDLKKAQTKHEWKQDAWKELNTKIYDLFSGTLDTLTYESSYAKKKTTVSNPNVASVITSDNAMNSVQSLKIDKLATTGYMTGGEMKAGTTSSTTMKDLFDTDVFGADGTAKIKVKIGDKEREITLNASSKVSDVVNQLKKTGLNVNYDTATNRMFIGSSASGEKNDFTISSDDTLGSQVLDKLGLSASAGAVKKDGQNAEIILNDAKFVSDKNTFDINGMTITCLDETKGSSVTLTTQEDTSGIYDMIKDFIKEYSALINEMDKLYNAESAKGYEPLTDEEKEALSETEVEKWETKIKDSLFRRDSTLSSVSSAMREIMSSGFEVGGKTMYLSDFGIETLGYFDAPDNEKHAYHINGDEDDSNVKNKTNDLMAAISKDPDQVVKFFTQLSKGLKSKLDDLMRRTDYSSMYTVYEDKKMKEEYDEYTKKIAEAEEKLLDYESKWYKKFSAMETAMAKMQSNASAITGLLGM
ncbi:MAG: flagellar filament capping protein FliD [Lachnospiraceae bacterium]|nr:flagellar filament capping protein FliD [Lachnospiraceae bacterium]